MSKEFIESFEAMQLDINENAIAKGFWDSTDVFQKTVLMHSEVSELVEALRLHEPKGSDKIPQFSNAEEECADIVIRVMDFAKQHKFDLARAIIAKNEFNKTRPYKHGKKC